MFGATSKLPSIVLPTNADVVRYFNEVRFNLVVDSRNPSFFDVAEPAILEVEKIWKMPLSLLS